MNDALVPKQLTARDVLRSSSVRRLLGGSLAFHIGVTLQAATLGKQVFDITGRALDIGWLGLAEFVPVVVFVFLSGSVADRFNRKYVAACALGGELVCAVSLSVYAYSEPTAVWPIFLIAVMFGTSRAFLSPATRSMAPMVAPIGGLPPIVALSSGVWTSAMIVGPAVSGFLYSIHPGIAYVTTSVLAFIGIIGILRVQFVRPPTLRTPDDKPTLHSAYEGLHFIRRTPILLAAISLDLFAVLFGGAIALLPVIAETRLHVGDVAYGWLRASAGIGAALMAGFLALRPLRQNIGRMLLVSVAIFGVGTIVLGATTSNVVAFVAVLVLSAADMVSVFIRGSIVPLVTPDEKRGRVSAVENVFIGATNELGAFESGVASQAFGTPAAVIAGGIATVGIVGIWWIGFPSLRDIDRFGDLETPENPA
ncbi:MAG: MFS transporter [Ilumatobacteraceae bacterium]